MALTYSPEPEIGNPAPDFALPDAVGGLTHALKDFSDAEVLVVAFLCQHCPYVQAVQGRIAQLAREYFPRGVRFVAICSNDSMAYPADAPAGLKKQAEQEGFIFPYLVDESQQVGRAYGAVATPDFFVYARSSEGFRLAYRGRLDDNWKEPAKVTRREMAEAFDEILDGKKPKISLPSMGCSIKWR